MVRTKWSAGYWRPYLLILKSRCSRLWSPLNIHCASIGRLKIRIQYDVHPSSDNVSVSTNSQPSEPALARQSSNCAGLRLTLMDRNPDGSNLTVLYSHCIEILVTDSTLAVSRIHGTRRTLLKANPSSLFGPSKVIARKACRMVLLHGIRRSWRPAPRNSRFGPPRGLCHKPILHPFPSRCVPGLP